MKLAGREAGIFLKRYVNGTFRKTDLPHMNLRSMIHAMELAPRNPMVSMEKAQQEVRKVAERDRQALDLYHAKFGIRYQAVDLQKIGSYFKDEEGCRKLGFGWSKSCENQGPGALHKDCGWDESDTPITDSTNWAKKRICQVAPYWQKQLLVLYS